MPNERYQQYLKSPEWRALRDQVLARDKYRCFECGARCALEVHHTTYKRIFQEHLDDLISLCPACHDDEHKPRKVQPKVKVLPYRPPAGPSRGSKKPKPEYSTLPRRAEDIRIDYTKTYTAGQANKKNWGR
jgi:5-methylcytosine-specific restriction endonuclease McrA